MKNLYLYKSGALKKQDYSLVLETKEEEILFPIEQIDQIFCFGTITLNTRLLEFLNTKGIGVTFFNFYGNCTGRYLPVNRRAGELLAKQVEAVRNPAQPLSIARSIQLGAFKNMLNLVKYYQKREIELKSLIKELELMILEIPAQNTVDNLMLLEARYKKAYYSAFDKILNKADGFEFIHRSKQPLENPFNALLSYGNSLLYATILAEIDRSPLLPEISFIHSLNNRGASLHLDLADIFKPVLVDRMCLRLIRRRSLKIYHFERVENGCYLNKEGVKIFAEEFHEILKETVALDSRPLSYQSILKREIYNLANFIGGQSNTYTPYTMKW